MLSILTVILGFFFIVLCLFLMLIVLLQPGKSGGLGGLGGGSASSAISESLGATQAEKSLANWTSWGMGIFFILCLLLTFLVNFHQSGGSGLNLPSATDQAAETTGAGGAAVATEGAAEADSAGTAAEAPATEDPVDE